MFIYSFFKSIALQPLVFGMSKDTESENKMCFHDVFKKVKSLRLFEPSLGILGFFLVTLFVIFSFFLLDYKAVINKGTTFSVQSDGLSWLIYDRGSSDNERKMKKIEFLSDEGSGCNLFQGDWIWDDNYPLYNSTDCRFLDEGFRCSENGRPDVFYTKWRWQPKDCILPRFDAKKMLENLRNRRVVFVGDSIGRNQWESLLCMLSSAVSNKDSIYEVNGNPITKHKGFLIFKFKEYNCTIEYHRAPFLVLQSRPPKGVASKIRTTLKLDRMDWGSSKWRDADVLVLNTAHWWNYEKTLRGGCYFQVGSKVKMDMDVDKAYERALQTVLNWIQHDLNSSKTQVFFRTFAPVHFRSGDWKTGGSCHKETLPELSSFSMVPSNTWTKYSIFADLISAHSNMSNLKAIDILNITNMSARRKDGHSSLYYLGPNQGPVSLHRQDCSHWCLPGVPDTWNELMYAIFIKREASRTPNSWAGS